MDEDTKSSLEEFAGRLEVEYQEANQNYRHTSNIRFALLTLFSALTGGLFIVLFNNQRGRDSLPPFTRASLKVVGILISLTLYLLEARNTAHQFRFSERLVELEGLLGYHQHTGMYPLYVFPLEYLCSSTVVSFLIYVGAAVFWIITLYYPGKF